MAIRFAATSGLALAAALIVAQPGARAGLLLLLRNVAAADRRHAGGRRLRTCAGRWCGAATSMSATSISVSGPRGAADRQRARRPRDGALRRRAPRWRDDDEDVRGSRVRRATSATTIAMATGTTTTARRASDGAWRSLQSAVARLRQRQPVLARSPTSDDAPTAKPKHHARRSKAPERRQGAVDRPRRRRTRRDATSPARRRRPRSPRSRPVRSGRAEEAGRRRSRSSAGRRRRQARPAAKPSAGARAGEGGDREGRRPSPTSGQQPEAGSGRARRSTTCPSARSTDCTAARSALDRG